MTVRCQQQKEFAHLEMAIICFLKLPVRSYRQGRIDSSALSNARVCDIGDDRIVRASRAKQRQKAREQEIRDPHGCRLTSEAMIWWSGDWREARSLELGS